MYFVTLCVGCVAIYDWKRRQLYVCMWGGLFLPTSLQLRWIAKLGQSSRSISYLGQATVCTKKPDVNLRKYRCVNRVKRGAGWSCDLNINLDGSLLLQVPNQPTCSEDLTSPTTTVYAMENSNLSNVLSAANNLLEILQVSSAVVLNDGELQQRIGDIYNFKQTGTREWTRYSERPIRELR